MPRRKQDLPNEISKDEVWNVINYANALYGQLQGFVSDEAFYNPISDNKLLVETNNNPKIPTSLDELKKAIANYNINAETLQGYSEFMSQR